MLFYGKQKIEEQDLLSLVGTSRETQDVDFKRYAYPQPPKAELPSDQSERQRVRNKWKFDLCTDLAAFANARGGWIICGMKEEGGRATELTGIGATIDAEREVARLEQCAMSGIEPALPRLDIQPVDLGNNEKAIVIHVPRSFRAPHRVRETSMFYIRRSGRNDPMNIDELRTAFNLSENLIDRVKNFRKERIEALAESHREEIPVPLENGAVLILHVIPIVFSDPASFLDLSAFQSHGQAMWVFQKGLAGGRFNLEGYVKPRGNHGYTQIFRNGAVECAEVIPTLDLAPPPDKVVSLYSLEDIALYYLDSALYVQEKLGVQLPSAVLLSLIGVKDYILVSDKDWHFHFPHHSPFPLNRNEVLLPDTLTEDYGSEPKTIMKPVFDILWNAGGWDQSRSYFGEDDDWIRS